MHLFSTIFFVDGNPINYEVRLIGEIHFLYPSDNPQGFINPPVLQAKKHEGFWKISGTSDRDLVDQVIEDLNLNQDRLSSY